MSQSDGPGTHPPELSWYSIMNSAASMADFVDKYRLRKAIFSALEDISELLLCVVIEGRDWQLLTTITDIRIVLARALTIAERICSI
jgi:hypothetical protein